MVIRNVKIIHFIRNQSRGNPSQCTLRPCTWFYTVCKAWRSRRSLLSVRADNLHHDSSPPATTLPLPPDYPYMLVWKVLEKKKKKKMPCGGNVNWWSPMVTVWRSLKKLKIELSYDSAIPFLGVYLKKKTKILVQKDMWISIYTAVQFNHSVVSDSLWSHGLWCTRLPCASPTPRACSNSCPSSQRCHPSISSSVIPFSSCLQSFPASGSFPMS